MKLKMDEHGPLQAKVFTWVVKLLRGAAAFRDWSRRMKPFVPVVSLEFVGFHSKEAYGAYQELSQVRAYFAEIPQ